MIDRKYIEKLLEMNGSSVTAPDDEIRSVLIEAKFHDDDVESAITVLRENVNTHKSRVEKVNNIFSSDKRLSPEAIHSLLGIDVAVDVGQLNSSKLRGLYLYYLQVVSIFVVAAVIAVLLIVAVMYYQQIGYFHPSFS